MNYFEALSQLNNTLIKNHLINGGLLALSWEELNEHEDRQNSFYTKKQADELLTSLQNIISEDSEWIACEIDNVGLCIDLPAMSESKVEEVMTLLSSVLSQEDIESLEWDLCNADGSAYY